MGLGNPVDAPSRNLQSDIIDSCRALGIRPRYMPTPPSVVGIIKLAAARIRSLTAAERSTSKGHSNFNAGDGPQPISCHRTPPKGKRGPCMSTPEAPVQLLPTRRVHRSEVARRSVFRSPPKKPCNVATIVAATRSPPPATATKLHVPQGAPLTTPKAARVLSLDTADQAHKAKYTAVVPDLIVNAYPEGSKYAMRPRDIREFDDMVPGHDVRHRTRGYPRLDRGT